MTWGSTVSVPLRRLGRRFWITFLLACAIAEGGEFVFEKLAESDSDRAGFTGSLFTASGLYQRIITAPRKPRVRFTAVVEIDPENDFAGVSDANVCAEREFLAHLLLRISAAQPAMIVIDKYFGRETCDANDSGTEALRKAVATVRLSQPIVVGLRTKAADPDASSTAKDMSYIEDALRFGPQGSVGQGIINIVRDNRRLPLQWQVYADKNSVNKSRPVIRDTLALAASRIYDPHLLEKNPRLERLLSSGKQPFIGFLEVDDFNRSFAHFYASEVVCGRRAAAKEDWHTCEGEYLPPSDLRHQIVLVGENDRDRDEHYSIVGRIPGFYLQANYIEALLDDRYYTPGGSLLDYAFAFLFLLCLELILIVSERRLARTIAMIFGLVVASYALLYVVVIHLNVYIDPLPIGATAVLIKILHLAYDYVQRDKPAAEARRKA